MGATFYGRDEFLTLVPKTFQDIACDFLSQYHNQFFSIASHFLSLPKITIPILGLKHFSNFARPLFFAESSFFNQPLTSYLYQARGNTSTKNQEKFAVTNSASHLKIYNHSPHPLTLFIKTL